MIRAAAYLFLGLFSLVFALLALLVFSKVRIRSFFSIKGDGVFQSKAEVSLSAASGLLKFHHSLKNGTEVRFMGFSLNKLGAGLMGKAAPFGATKKEAEKATVENKGDGKKIFSALKSKAPRKRFLVFLKEFKGSIRIFGEAQIQFGLGDPGKTGVLYGQYCALNGVFGLSKVSVSPNFEKRLLVLEGKLGADIILAKIIFSLLKFLFSEEVRPFWIKKGFVREDGKKREKEVGATV